MIKQNQNKKCKKCRPPLIIIIWQTPLKRCLVKATAGVCETRRKQKCFGFRASASISVENSSGMTRSISLSGLAQLAAWNWQALAFRLGVAVFCFFRSATCLRRHLLTAPTAFCSPVYWLKICFVLNRNTARVLPSRVIRTFWKLAPLMSVTVSTFSEITGGAWSPCAEEHIWFTKTGATALWAPPKHSETLSDRTQASRCAWRDRQRTHARGYRRNSASVLYFIFNTPPSWRSSAAQFPCFGRESVDR